MSTTKLKRVAIALLIMCGMTTGASAAPLPDAPSAAKHAQAKPPNVYLSPFRDPWFYGGVLTATSGIIADVHFVQGCERARTCYELNPGADKYSHRAIEIGLVGAMSYGCSVTLHEHKWLRGICAIGPVALGVKHWRDTHISYITKRSPFLTH